jgi:hypothetical protein
VRKGEISAKRGFGENKTLAGNRDLHFLSLQPVVRTEKVVVGSSTSFKVTAAGIIAPFPLAPPRDITAWQR